MTDWPGGLPVGGYNVTNLRYADDTTLIATSVANMAEFLKRVKVESELLCLRLNVSRTRLNVSRTKIMAKGPDCLEEPLIIDGNEVELISKFNFIGSLITKDDGCSQEIRHRLVSNGTFSNDKPVQDLG